MKEITLSGTPTEIGKKHGGLGKEEVIFSLETYQKFFMDKANITWDKAKEIAISQLNRIEKYNLDYIEEMHGIAKGAGVDFEDILVLNSRSEIALTHNTVDGCTSLAVLSPLSSKTFLGQNWDWRPNQKGSLLLTKIYQKDKPDICMITEGGIIGKIGFNSFGLGVCLNAIRANVRSEGVPIHIGLRAALDCTSVEEATSRVSGQQMSSTANFLLAQDYGKDQAKSVNIELSPIGEEIITSTSEALYHTNHICSLKLKTAIGENNLYPSGNSFIRIDRMQEFITKAKTNGEVIDEKIIKDWFSDHFNHPESICRHEDENTPEHMQSKTVFSVIMDLSNRSMLLMEGNPCSAKNDQVVHLMDESL